MDPTSGTSLKSMPRWAGRTARKRSRTRIRLPSGSATGSRTSSSARPWPRPRVRRWPRSGAGSNARWLHSNPISCRFGWSAEQAMREPSFWWGEAGLASSLLAPLAMVYGAVAGLRLGAPGRRAGVPVVCAGNLTVGGGGKTPTALAVARLLAHAGERPIFLSRGYGGRLAGPLRVDPARHRALDVGDEPLLLARVAPTVVARDRIEGARMAVAAGASVIVMDDGFQNPSLAKDLSLLVVDARRGVGNGRIIPAGPLRAPARGQLARAHALVVIGTSAGAEGVIADARADGLPVLHARLRPDAGLSATLAGACWPLPASRTRRSFSRPWPKRGSRLAQRGAFPTITATRRARHWRYAR